MIRQDYRASVNAGYDDTTICLLPYNGDYECIELKAESWKMYFSGLGQKIFPSAYFHIDPHSGRMTYREYIFDIMNLLGCSEAYIEFDPHSDQNVISYSRYPRYTTEDLRKGKSVPQLFRDTFDDCYARLEDLRTTFPEYEVNTISLLGERILPVKKNGESVLIDIENKSPLSIGPIDDYQIYKDKLYIASDDKVLVCDDQGTILQTYKIKDWDSSILWE